MVVTSVVMKWMVVPAVVNSVVWSYMKLTEGTLGYEVSESRGTTFNYLSFFS